METLIIAGGCFWCTEAIFRDLKGVQSVESGYIGGQSANPTYREVCSGTTGHAEAIRITFDPAEIDRRDLLRIFFSTHDPTTLNRQGGDVGTQYRSAVFVHGPDEAALVQSVIAEIEAEKLYDRPIVTTIEPATEFYVAEDYHQDYFERFENAALLEKLSFNAGYCQAVIAPKVSKFRQKYQERLRR